MWFTGLKNSGDGVQNLVPRVPYGAPTSMVTLHRKMAHFEGPGSLSVGRGAQTAIIRMRGVSEELWSYAFREYTYASGGGETIDERGIFNLEHTF